MAEIQKGIISTIEGQSDRNGDFTKARVLPVLNPNMPTLPLTIPWYLRGKMGNLKIGDLVIFSLFDDFSGIIFARMDGEWSGIIPGNLQILGSGNVEKTFSAKDITTEQVASLNSHEHPNGNNGNSTGPPIA